MSVYTTLDNNDLHDFLNAFDVGIPVDLQGISDGIENTNYFVTTRHHNEKRRFVLTIFESLQHTELPFFLDLMAFLAENGIPCAHPVADRNGHYLQTIKNKPAALVQRLPGRSIARPGLSHCRQIGEILARLHTAGQKFPQSRRNTRGHAWFEQTAAALQPRLAAADLKLLTNELSFQAANIRDASLPAGIIHADLFHDNALFEQDRLSGIIDFYYACQGTFLYDLAITVNDWCSTDSGELQAETVRELLSAYHGQRPLLDAERHYWPVMLRAAALRFWLSRLYDLHFPRCGEITHTHDPDVFKRILIHRIQQHETLKTLWV